MNHLRLGGTSIAALMGEDSFRKTPYDLYMRIIHGQRTPQNAYMVRGLAMEAAIRARFVSETGAELEPHPGTVLYGEAFAASVDDLFTREFKRGVVDYKTASAKSLPKWKNGMLSSYSWQLRLYLAVFQRQFAELFVAFGVDTLDPDTGAWLSFDITETRCYSVERDLEIEQRMLAAGEAFWAAHIVPKIPPYSPITAQLRTERIATGATLSAADLEWLCS